MSDAAEITPSKKEGSGKFVVNEETYIVKYQLRVSSDPQPKISGTVTNFDTEETEKKVAFANSGGEVGTLHLDDGHCLDLALNTIDFFKQQGTVAVPGNGFYLCNED